MRRLQFALIGLTIFVAASAVGEGREPSTLVWMSRDGVHQAILVAVPDSGPAASPSTSPGPSGSGEATPKP